MLFLPRGPADAATGHVITWFLVPIVGWPCVRFYVPQRSE